MHLRIKLITFISLALAAVPFAKAEEGYWRASAIYIVPEAAQSDESVGAMVALGASFPVQDSVNTNEVEFEGGWSKWRTSLGAPTFGERSDMTFIPVLLTIRHQFVLTDTVRLAIGPSVGASYFKASGGIPSFAQNNDTSDWVFTYGGGATFYLTLSESVSLSVGYRYLFNDDANFKIDGTRLKVTDLSAHIFEIGLRFDWPY